MQALVDRHRQFVDRTFTNGKPVKFTQDGRDVIKLPVVENVLIRVTVSQRCYRRLHTMQCDKCIKDVNIKMSVQRARLTYYQNIKEMSGSQGCWC